jgi:hypothetical protein
VTDRVTIVGEQDNSGRVVEAHIVLSDRRGCVDLDLIEIADLHAAYATLGRLSDPQEIVGS